MNKGKSIRRYRNKSWLRAIKFGVSHGKICFLCHARNARLINFDAYMSYLYVLGIRYE